MAFFDDYEPSGCFACPVCGALQREWQGHDGPCGLFIFRERVPGAVGQRVDGECRLADAQLAIQRLPDAFFIRSHDCGCLFPTELRCTASGGVWQHTELFTGSNADRQQRWPEERRDQWQARLRWLGGGEISSSVSKRRRRGIAD
jgi:hypothetical protein